jgi:hypothetical protein
MEHARAMLEAMDPMTDGMYEALADAGVMWKDTNSAQVWSVLLAAAVAGK